MAESATLQLIIDAKDNASKELKGLSGQLKQLEPQLKKIAVGSAIAFGVMVLGIKSILSAAGELEQQTVAFTTLLGSEELALDKLKELSDFAAKTPFQVQGIRQSAKQLLAMGIEVDALLPTLKALGDVSAGLSQPLSRIALNFGQVATQGKLTGRELRDFAVLGVPLVAELAKNLDVTKEAIAGMVSEGKIRFKEVNEAFQTMTSEGGKFADLMDKQSKTLVGSWSNLKDEITITQEVIGKVLVPTFKQIINEGLIPLVNRIREFATANPKLTANILIVVTALTGMVLVVTLLALALPGLVLMFNLLGAAIATVTVASALWVAGIAIVVGIIAAIVIGLNSQKEALREVTDEEVDSVKKIQEAEIAKLDALIQAEQGKIGAITKTTAIKIDALEKEKQAHLDSLNEQFKDTELFVTSTGELIKKSSISMRTEWKAITQAIGNDFRAVGQNIEANALILDENMVTIVQNIGQVFSSMWKTIAVNASKAFEAVNNVFKGKGFKLPEFKVVTGGFSKLKSLVKLNIDGFMSSEDELRKLVLQTGKFGEASKKAGKAPPIPPGSGKAVKDLTDKYSKLGEALTKVKQASVDELTKLREAHADNLSSAGERIGTLRSQLSTLQADFAKTALAQKQAFAKQETSDRTGIAQAVLAQEKKVADIKAQIANSNNRREIIALEKTLTIEEEALTKHTEFIKSLDSSIVEARRRDALTEFERMIEDFQARRTEAVAEFENRRKEAQAELSARSSEIQSQINQVEAASKKETAIFLAKQEQITNLLEEAESMRLDITKKSSDAIIALVDTQIAKYNELAKAIARASQGKPGLVNQITLPAFADGGIVTKPTIGLIGEAGPEAIIPLNKFNSGGGKPIINVSIGTLIGAGMDIDELAELIGDTLVGKLTTNMRI